MAVTVVENTASLLWHPGFASESVAAKNLLSTDPLWECCNAITFLNPRETEVVKGLYNSAVITAKTRTNHQCLHRGKKEERNTLRIFAVRMEKNELE